MRRKNKKRNKIKKRSFVSIRKREGEMKVRKIMIIRIRDEMRFNRKIKENENINIGSY